MPRKQTPEFDSLKSTAIVEPLRDSAPAEDADALLMRRIAAGSEGALALLIEKWKNPLINFIYTSTGDFQLSEDIAMTVFGKVYNARAAYRAQSKFSTYLFKIARNEIITQFRKSQSRPFAPTDFDDMPLPAPKDSSAECSDIESAFDAALSALPEKQRTAITLYVREELPYADIAEIMREGVPAVKTLINRARAYLRDALKDFQTK